MITLKPCKDRVFTGMICNSKAVMFLCKRVNDGLGFKCHISPKTCHTCQTLDDDIPKAVIKSQLKNALVQNFDTEQEYEKRFISREEVIKRAKDIGIPKITQDEQNPGILDCLKIAIARGADFDKVATAAEHHGLLEE